jgi:cytochrome P450
MHDDPIPLGIVDVTSHEFTMDPGPGYDALRSATPISWQPAARGALLTRYADIAQAYKDRSLVAYDVSLGWRKVSRQAGVNLDPALNLFGYMPFIHEGRRHHQLRTAMAKGIAPFAAASEVYARRVEQLLAVVRRDDGFDLVKQFAGSLMFEILSDILEFPQMDRDAIRPLANISWALDSTLSVNKRRWTAALISKCMEPLHSHVREVLARPGTSMIHQIERSLPRDEADRVSATAHLVAVIVVMGNNAVAGCITYAVRHMLSEGGHMKRAVPQSHWAEISDDAIRYSSPVGFSTRMTTTPTAIGGCHLSDGRVLFLSPFAANRDPAVFGPDPNEIRPRPEVGVGLAFAAGNHVCVGLRMSRNIVESAYRGLARLPPLRLAGRGTQGPGSVVRTLESCPVEFH